MPHIRATDTTIMWAVGSPILDAGMLDEPGLLLTGLSLAHATGEMEFLSLVQGEATGYQPLPETGWLEAGDMYSWQDDIVIVRQSHNRTIYAPTETPALFLFYQSGAGTLDWIVGEQVYLGTRRMYNDVEYRCIQAHVTQTDWTPDATPTLWVIYQEPGQEWLPGVWYAVDVEVEYLENTYKCLQAHTSQIGWEPPNVPALWQLVAEPSPDWQVGVAYKVGDHVMYGGQEWICAQAHTSISTWYPGAPGVYLWTLV
jgi:hypothetical protein